MAGPSFPAARSRQLAGTCRRDGRPGERKPDRARCTGHSAIVVAV